MDKYRVIDALNISLITVDAGRFGTKQPWAATNKPLRTHKNCKNCGSDLYGKLAYRPIGNQGNRYERLCVDCVYKGILLIETIKG